jgi:hypothetical protein
MKLSWRGVEQMTRLCCGATTNTLFFTRMAIGCGDIAESNSHTKLHQEITAGGGARGNVDSYYITSSPTKANWKKTFTFTAATTIKEVGVFAAGPINASTMLCRHKLGASRSVVNGDTVTLTVSATFVM